VLEAIRMLGRERRDAELVQLLSLTRAQADVELPATQV
jgi:hypothetical protein